MEVLPAEECCGGSGYMIDVTKIDNSIKYLDFEPQKKFGSGWLWLAALLLAPYILALAVLLVGALVQ
jgi:hypothetical protein